jgi:hypothetical protein
MWLHRGTLTASMLTPSGGLLVVRRLPSACRCLDVRRQGFLSSHTVVSSYYARGVGS